MKSVLISIQPMWCEKIANGEKTIEVRKTRPKLETPFKCYVYCTKPKYPYEDYIVVFDKPDSFHAGGKVIGEFVCDWIGRYEAEFWDDDTFESIQELNEPSDFAEYGERELRLIATSEDNDWKDNLLCKASCLSIENLRKYIGAGITEFYGWHISDLKIYDQPKEISEFFKPCIKSEYPYCFDCEYGLQADEKRPLDGLRYFDVPCGNRLTKEPQSWCYVNEIYERHI